MSFLKEYCANFGGKPTTFLNSFVRKDFSKSTPVTQTHVSNDFLKPVTAQTLPTNKKSILKNTNVLAPVMYKLHTDHTQTRTSQLPQDSRKTNERVSFSTGVILTTSVSIPQLKSNPQGDRVMHNNSQGKKQEVEDQRRSVKLSKNKTSVTACNDSLNAKTLNVKYISSMCDKCVLHDKHDMCVLKSVAKPLKETVASEANKKLRNFTRKLYERVSKTCSWWYLKLTPSGYIWKPKSRKENVNPNLVEIVLFIVDSGCSKHMTGNLKLLINFVEKFWGTVKFGNDQIAPILGYGDLVQGAVTIKRVYYVEGLNHNLFSVGQFCDADLEVAFMKSTCFIRNLKGNDLLTGSRGTDLYSITLQDTNCPNPICLMAKATSSQAWLWHRHLSHLNFDTINLLSNNDIVVGLPKLKFVKDHLCSSCELGKAKRKSFHTKLTLSLKRWLQLLHMDLCGPMRVTSINGKRYVLVIVDDYSRYTWTHFLRSKDETPEVLIAFLRLVQRGLQAQVRVVRTDKVCIVLRIDICNHKHVPVSQAENLPIYPYYILTRKKTTMAGPIIKECISTTSKSFISNDINGKMIKKNFIEIEGTFLLKVRDNTFFENNGEDVFKHINSFLEVVEPLKIKGLSHDRFRLSVFPISLSGAASRWFTKECISTISTWDDLVERFVLKFYNLCDHEETEDNNDPNVIDNVPKIFKINDDLFKFDSPLCVAFEEFNHLLKIDPDLFTHETQKIKKYDEYEQKLNNKT
uniref:Uncharacterized protein n=1 Tax=Tanacetum cinerariifolium TaxID=118510 RepID=A0A6L2M9H9_TANCI|nr:hypothetical protein [Tanacetum cinerariifolium]